MNELNHQEDQDFSDRNSKLVLLKAIGTGLLFWTSLFGLLFFSLRT